MTRRAALMAERLTVPSRMPRYAVWSDLTGTYWVTEQRFSGDAGVPVAGPYGDTEVAGRIAQQVATKMQGGLSREDAEEGVL